MLRIVEPYIAWGWVKGSVVPNQGASVEWLLHFAMLDLQRIFIFCVLSHLWIENVIEALLYSQWLLDTIALSYRCSWQLGVRFASLLLLYLHVGHAEMIFSCSVWKSKSGTLTLPWNVACKHLKFFFWTGLFQLPQPEVRAWADLQAWLRQDQQAAHCPDWQPPDPETPW